MRTVLLLCVGLFALPVTSQAKETIGAFDEVGYLAVQRDVVDWPLPQSIVSDLRSDREDKRLNALHLLGVTDRQAHQADGKVIFPDQVELNYAALGGDDTQQAILAVKTTDRQLTLAAVATPTGTGWKRIAFFSCWCKYDLGGDSLATFIQVHSIPLTVLPGMEHFELVLHASGGGTGLYTQNEAHFRMAQDGTLRRVLSFVSRLVSCSNGGPDHSCSIEKRWFYPQTSDIGEQGGVLVEARDKVADSEPAEFYVRDLENRNLHQLVCTQFNWDAQKFRYQQSKQWTAHTDPCRP